MSKSDLTIITVAAYDKGFVDLMVRSVHKFTNPKPNIIICDNGGNGSVLSKYEAYDNVTVVTNERASKYNKGNKAFRSTSKRHGIGLNVAFKHVNTKRTAIIEPDCAVLKNGWDKIPDNYEMVACRKGVGAEGEHYYFPCFMVFYTKCLHRDGIIDFLPEFDSKEGEEGILIKMKKQEKRKYTLMLVGEYIIRYQMIKCALLVWLVGKVKRQESFIGTLHTRPMFLQTMPRRL